MKFYNLLILILLGFTIISASSTFITNKGISYFSSNIDLMNNSISSVSSFNNILYVQSGNSSDIQVKLDILKENNGGLLIIPSGNYSVTEPINITGANNVIIRGVGSSSNLIHNVNYNLTSGEIFIHETGHLSDFEISYLRFSSTTLRSELPKSRNIRIAGDSQENIKINNLIMEYESAQRLNESHLWAPAYGIQLNSVRNGLIDSNTLINFHMYPIECENCHDVTISNNYIRSGYYGMTGGSGSSRRMTVINNVIKPATNLNGFTYGMYFEHSDGEYIIKNNYIENASGSGGIRLSRTAGIGTYSYINIDGNTIINSDYPLDISNQRYVKVSNNIIPNWQDHSVLNLNNLGILDIGHNYINDSITFDTTNTTTILSTWHSYNTNFKGNITISPLSGTGNAYACLDEDGKLYRSATVCVE